MWPLSSIVIGDQDEGFRCSSSEVLNSFFEDLGRNIDPEQGLKGITFYDFKFHHDIQEWPLLHIAMKCHALEELTIVPRFDCTSANRVQLFEFAGLAVSKSKCLRKIDLMCT